MSSNPSAESAADAALRIVDKLLAQRPDMVGHDFSEAVHRTVLYREELTRIWRRSGSEQDRQRLARVNAVISVVVGGHYHLGVIPWPHIKEARNVLGELAAGS